YRYWVRTTAPHAEIPLFELGVPADLVLTATQPGATAFTYRIDDGPERTLPVGEDGTGRVTLTFSEAEGQEHDLVAWTVDASGARSGVTSHPFYVDQLRPWVDVDVWFGLVGQKRVFTVTPNRDGVVSYAYRIGDAPEVSVPAAPDGSLTFEHTPTEPGLLDVFVVSVNAAGIRSGRGESSILAEAPAPTVASADYPGYPEAGGPGVTGAFAFSSPRLPVVSYRYAFNGGAQQEVAAGADGSAVVRWAPPAPGYHYLRVRGVTAAGVETDERSFSFWVKPLPPTVTSPQFPEGGQPTAVVGQPVEFEVTPALAGSHEVLWQLGFGQPQVVPVGPDGRARFTYTPLGAFQLTVSSRTPDGVVSGQVTRTYEVR
ncbi:hypothetical protein ACFV4N_19070, partial [Actinosynnema sp. NPDC059797]